MHDYKVLQKKNYYSKLMLFSPRIRTSNELFITNEKKKLDVFSLFLKQQIFYIPMYMKK